MKVINELSLLFLWLLAAVLLLAAFRGLAVGKGPLWGMGRWIGSKFSVVPVAGSGGGASIKAVLPAASAHNGTVNGITQTPYGLIVNGVKA